MQSGMLLKVVQSRANNSSGERQPREVDGECRGIVTADVLVKGLGRGAIATRKLKGVKTGQRTRRFILVRLLAVKVKA